MNTLERKEPPLALVTGLTGGVGGAVAQALLAAGWRVRTLHREPLRGRRLAAAYLDPAAIEWESADALDQDALCRAARGARILFHGVNPPQYRNWRSWALPMLTNAIEAAGRSGARLIFPGNIYNFAADAGAIIDESAPQNPSTRKGRIRFEMEALLKEAAKRRGVRSLVVRAGDYFGPTQPRSWLAQGIVKPGRPVRAITYPGGLEVGHAFAYLPDLAQTIVRLTELEPGLPDFDVFHFGGHWVEEGRVFCEAIREAVADPYVPIKAFPWWMIQGGSPFIAVFREVLEMRYLWQRPLRLDNQKLIRLIGPEPHTPLVPALRECLAALGCVTLPEPSFQAGVERRVAPDAGAA
jgi:nucleoside-diphosphate-sugar epimerase